MIKIGLIGTESMHAWSFAAACNVPDEKGNLRFPNATVSAIYGVDDNDEHINFTMEKGNVKTKVNSFEELLDKCNAFMILQRRGDEHLKYAEEIIKRGYPVFIDKPVCKSDEDMEKLDKLVKEHKNVICYGSGLKYNKQVKELKNEIDSYMDEIRGATINHSADFDCPYDGIFFYLSHAVEIMLELFGYDPKSLSLNYLSNNNFTVCVKYSDKLINLAISSCYPTYIVINSSDASKSKTVEVKSDDIFIEGMRNFVNSINNNIICEDTEKLLKAVKIIKAVYKAKETGKEVVL